MGASASKIEKPRDKDSPLLAATPGGEISISGRGAGRYIRFDPWSWLSLQRAQA
jgi:hypothetical protein